MNLYVVRHGESIGNTQRGFISGRIDQRGLTIKGRSQIIRIAWELKNIKFQQILTSPIVRTKETAAILSNALGVTKKTEEFLNELDHGLAEGQYWWTVRQYFPKSRGLTDWHEDFESPYLKGESFKMLSKRVWNGYQKLTSGSQNVNYILVTHQAIIATLMYCHLFGDPENSSAHYLDYIHSAHMENGAYIVLSQLNNKRFSNQFGPFSSLAIWPETVKFYVTSTLLLSANSFTLKKVITASRNLDFIIRNKHQYMIKIVGQKETVNSLRLTKIYHFLAENALIIAPRIISLDKTGVFFKNAVLIQDYNEGVEESVCLKYHPAQVYKLQQDIYQNVKKIHALKKEEVMDFWEPNDWYESYPSWNSKYGDLYLVHELNLTVDKLQQLATNKTLFKKVALSLAELKKYIVSGLYPLVPLHGDLAPQNLIVSHQKRHCYLVRILDFERVRIGDAMWDYVYYYGWLERENTGVAQAWKNLFWKGLSSKRRKYFELYRILFHAWTVRDGIEYTKNRERQLLAKKSLEILRTNF